VIRFVPATAQKSKQKFCV